MSEQRRITPPADQEAFLMEVAEVMGSTKQKALMFAAAFGKREGRRVPLSKRGEGIRLDIFETSRDDGFISCLAVAEAGQLDVLGRPEECLTIFEEYAYGGLLELKTRWDRFEDRLDGLIRLTDEPRADKSTSIPGIDASVLRGLI